MNEDRVVGTATIWVVKRKKVLAVRPAYQGVAHAIGLFEREPKERSDESGRRADDRRQQRQREKISRAAAGVDGNVLVARQSRQSPLRSLAIRRGSRLRLGASRLGHQLG